MTAVIVNSATPFGNMSNVAISKLIEAVHEIHRVRQAVTNAQAGAANPNEVVETGSNFGVVPSSTPGEQGAAYVYALNVLDDALQSFAVAYKDQMALLDNGA